MSDSTTKADLHLHSRFSRRPTQWVLQKLGCPESFSEPKQLYDAAKDKGMSLVTVTDHNSISGCLEIAHLPGAFLSEEVTAYFPEDGCKVHILVHDITVSQHVEIQRLRENIFELALYLAENGIPHALAHPLYSVNDRLTIAHFENLLLLFKVFELNGARDEAQNIVMRRVLAGITPAFMDEISDRHDLAPLHPEPWRKHLIGGSDDHSSLHIACTYTEADGELSVADFIRAVYSGEGRVCGSASTPRYLARNIYGIAYQFYKTRLGLDRHVGKDDLLLFLDRFLTDNAEPEEGGIFSRLHLIRRFRNRRTTRKSAGADTIQGLIKRESRALIRHDPELLNIAEDGSSDPLNRDDKWFLFVNRLSNKVLRHFADHIFDRFSGADVFNIFHSIGSAGGLYTLLAPYFVSYAVFGKGRGLGREVEARFLSDAPPATAGDSLRVGHFTDTYHEVNGVALTLRQQAETAMRLSRDLTIVTCSPENGEGEKNVRNFKPLKEYELPEYPEQKLYLPPFLEMLDYAYERGFTHIHSATPGPIGMAALGIARILKLPFYSTYHTQLPQYARALTNDPTIEDLVRRFTIWYYDQAEIIFCPSQSTADELVGWGLAASKMRVFPRGIDIDHFHPSKRNGFFSQDADAERSLRLVYVGRVSREKDLHVLEKAYRGILERTDRRVHLVVVGDGPYRAEMEANMKGLPVTFTGYLDGEDLASAYASSDIFVFPSTTDTFGNVVLEAQASGLPVIVSDRGGPCENMIHGETGLITIGEDEESFAAAILSLANDDTRRTHMSKAARDYVEERSFESAFYRTWDMYHESRETTDEPAKEMPSAAAA